jgi:hypothetical protein
MLHLIIKLFCPDCTNNLYGTNYDEIIKYLYNVIILKKETFF